jgi:hypothetical protein
LDPQEAATEKSKREGGEIRAAPMKLTETNFKESDEAGDAFQDDFRHAGSMLRERITMEKIWRINNVFLDE